MTNNDIFDVKGLVTVITGAHLVIDGGFSLGFAD